MLLVRGFDDNVDDCESAMFALDVVRVECDRVLTRGESI